MIRGVIDTFESSADGLAAWWNAEKPRMIENGLSHDSNEFKDLYEAFKAKGQSLRNAETGKAA